MTSHRETDEEEEEDKKLDEEAACSAGFVRLLVPLTRRV